MLKKVNGNLEILISEMTCTSQQTLYQGSRGYRDPWDLKRLGDNWSLSSNNRVLEAVCLDKLVSEHLKKDKSDSVVGMHNYIYYNLQYIPKKYF